MRFVTHIVAAEDDEYAAIGESNHPLDEWSGIESPGLDTLKLATLHCLLTGDTLQMALELYEPVYVASSEAIILRVADQVLEKLTVLGQGALTDVATELAATEEFEREQRPVEDVLAFLMELAELAQLAESQGQVLFVWMSLIQG